MRLWLSIIEIGHLKEINILYLNNEITAADEINTLRKFFMFHQNYLNKSLPWLTFWDSFMFHYWTVILWWILGIRNIWLDLTSKTVLKYKFWQGLSSSSDCSIRDFLLVQVTLASKIYAGKSKSDVKVAKQDFTLLHTLTLN